MFHLSCIGTSLIWPYFFSNCASVTTHQMVLFGETVFNSKWFNYPPELQKYMVLVIARSQYPSQFTGLGLFECSLEAFAQVSFFKFMFQPDLRLTLVLFKIIKSSLSFYMIFRKISDR